MNRNDPNKHTGRIPSRRTLDGLASETSWGRIESNSPSVHGRAALCVRSGREATLVHGPRSGHAAPSTVIALQWTIFRWQPPLESSTSGKSGGPVGEPSKYDLLAPATESLLDSLRASGTVAGAEQIDEIRERAEEVCTTAESHLRVLVKQLPPLTLAEQTPDWLSGFDSACDSRAIASANLLVRAILQIVGSDTQAVCEPSDDGALEISWDTPKRLTWVVGRPRMAWPGINVRTYSRIDEQRPAMDVRSFFLAHRAINHARSILL